MRVGAEKRPVLAKVVLALPVVVASLVAGWTFVGFKYTGWFTDSLDYLWFADFYLQSFGGEVSPEAEATYRATRFPPLLPLLIAAVGGGSANPGAATALMFVLFVACAGLSTWWAYRATRDLVAAVLCGLSLAISPGWFLLQQSSPVSEPLMLALVLGALLLAGDGPLTRGRALALALVAGAIPLARTIGIAMVIPVAIRLLGDRGLGRLRFGLAGIAILPVLAWSLLRSTLPQAENYTDSLTLESIRSVYGGIVPWLAGQPFRMIEGAAGALANVPGPVAISLSGLLAVLAVLAAIVGWRRLDAQFLVIYCGIVFVWPFPAEMPRFMALLLPIVLVLAARGAVWLAGLRAARPAWSDRRLLAGLAVAAMVVSLPGVTHNAYFALRKVDPELEPFKRFGGYFMAGNAQVGDQALEFAARLVGAMQVLPEYVPAGECVYALSPQMVFHYGKVASVRTPLNLADAGDARERLIACRYLLAMSAPTSQHGESPMYPAALVADQVEPLFISYMEVSGQRYPAVGLFDLAALRRSVP
jgi:hypothetical protein